ncbi:MAG: hypothetical protein ACTSRS_10035 [Candidatus Helarchaeota archaeon]
MEDPPVRAREMFLDFEDSRGGKIRYIGMPYKLSETPLVIFGLEPMDIGQIPMKYYFQWVIPKRK